MSRKLILPSLLLSLPLLGCHNHDHPHPHNHLLLADAPDPALQKANKEMADAALSFWTSLTPEQQATCRWEFKDEQRFDWHFIPKTRKGLVLKDMTDAQRALANAFLSTGLSQRGYLAATTIMSLEQILRETEQGRAGAPNRDAGAYFWSIFGTPGGKEPWGWRVEGHHLSLNFTVLPEGAIIGAPQFYGTNPAEVRTGARKGLRVLAYEEDMARKLVKSLPEAQRKVAIFNEKAPADILTMNARKAEIKEPTQGIAYADLSVEHRAALMELLEMHVNRTSPAIASGMLRRAHAAGLDKLRFAWAGPTEPGQGHYYRILGPTLLVEYDNTQNNANHVHAVLRDLENDFGGDLLKRHYDTAGKEHGHDAK
jgi:hypothetical protein